MINQFSRTELIYGKKAIEEIKKAHVAVFGIGGVGGYVCEALARSGVSHFTLVDDDKVVLSNLNRQIIATVDSIGKDKVEVMKERILSINPDAAVETRKCFFMPENQDEFDFSQYSYVVDCIDTVTAKIALVMKANEANVPIISCMGAGNKVNPMGFIVTDINKTEMDPLAKVMRRELRQRGIKKLKVVYSKEQALTPLENDDMKDDIQGESGERSGAKKRTSPGSSAFVPSAAGLLIASEVFRDLTESVAREELKRQ